MTEPTSNPPRRGARTFRVACAVLATVAAAQAVATAWGSKPAEFAGRTAPVAEAPHLKPADPFMTAAGEADPHPEMQAPAGDPPPNDPAVTRLKPQAVFHSAKVPAPLDAVITDEEVLENLDSALHLRGQGDMQGSLTKLRAALKRLPDHPRLLYQMARTLDIMGLSRRAEPYWRALHQLGKGAGDFYVLAQDRMADGPQALGEPDEQKERKFTVVDLRDEKLPDDSRGERVQFSAVIKKNTTEAIDLEKLRDDMILAIHFFDSVNGRRIARSQVPPPELVCVSEPLDWSEATETFAFEYWQPDMSPEQIRKHGRCKYYGCTLEVIFKDQLQDNAATTPECLQYARELPLPDPEPQDSILDSGAGPAPGPQPEASLFPSALPAPR